MHDVQFSCTINQPLLAHHWMAHQCLLMSRFVAPSIPWGVSAPGGKMRKQLLTDHKFLNNSPIFSLKVLLLIYCFSKSTAYNTFQFEKLFWIWWKVLDTIILWQDVGPCCEQTHAAFEVGLSLDQGQGVYSGWSDVVGSSQLRLCHTCILDVMHVYTGLIFGHYCFFDNHHLNITGLTWASWHPNSPATPQFVHQLVPSSIKEDSQSSALLAFVRRIHQWPVEFPYKGSSNAEFFPYHDVIMI